MFKVGITGGIGSGKTLVCSILKTLGVPVYSADIEARRLMNTDQKLKGGIVKLFGDKAYNKDGLDTFYLAGSVFGDSIRLARLNELVHPAVRKDFKRWSTLFTGAPYVVEEAAILFESGAVLEMDLSVLVFAPEELRIGRVMERDQVEREAVIKRMNHQMSEEDKLKIADHVIYNDEVQMLLPQVIELHNKIVKSIE